MYKLDRALFEKVSPRIHVDIQEPLQAKLEALFSNEKPSHANDLLYNRILFLRQVPLFKNVPGDILAEISDLVKIKELPQNQPVNLDAEETKNSLFIVVEGGLFGHNNLGDEINLNPMAGFGNFLMLDNNHTYTDLVTTSDTVLYEIDQHELFSMMSTFPELVRGFIHNINVEFHYKSLEIEEPLFELDF